MRRNWIFVVLALPLLPCGALLLYAAGWIPSKGILITAFIMMALIELSVVLTVVFSGHGGSRNVGPIDEGSILYADGLVTILKDRIIFHHYNFRSRELLFSELDAIRALPPTLKNGKWRLSGTGDFDTWFPSDWRRPRRDTIFRAELKRPGDYNVGFTVKDSARVRALLRELGVLHPVCSRCQYDLRASTGQCPECGANIPADR
jgi:hypothetical protein